MSHGVPSPTSVALVHKTRLHVQPFGRGVGDVNQQPYRLIVAVFLYESLEQGRRNALPPAVFMHGQRVDIIFACLRFVVHPAEVPSQFPLRGVNKRLAQAPQILTVVARDDARKAPALHGGERIAVAVLRMLHAHEAGEQAVKVGQCMVRTRKVPAAVGVHRLHDEASYLGCLLGRGRLNAVFHGCKVTYFLQ